MPIALAGGALDLGWLVIAFACLIVLFAVSILVATMQRALTLGGSNPVTNVISGWLNSFGLAVGTLADWFWSMIHAATNFVGMWNWFVVNLWNPFAGFAGSVGGALARIVTVTIPGAVNQAIAQSYQFVASGIAGVEAAFSIAYNYLGQQLAAVEATLTADLQLQISRLEGELQSERLARDAAISVAVGGATSILSDVIRGVEADVAAVRGDVTVVETDIATQVLPRIGGIERDISQSIAPALAATGAAVAAVSTDWFRWRDNCGNNLCNNLGSFASSLSDVETAAEMVALLTLIAAIIQDPQGVKAEIETLLVAPAQDLVHSVTGK